MTSKKNNAVFAVVVVATIVGAVAYFLVSGGDGSVYKSKLVPAEAPSQVHHPWTSKKKSKP